MAKCPVCDGRDNAFRGMSDKQIYDVITDYSHGVVPKPTAQPAGKTKTQTVIGRAFHEVFSNKPSTVKTSMSAPRQRKQMIAIALSKARAAGARIPKK
jgi:hypothetical protein